MDTPTYTQLLKFLNSNREQVDTLPNCGYPPSTFEYDHPVKLAAGLALEVLGKYAEKSVPQYIGALERRRNSIHKATIPLAYRQLVVVAFNTLIQEILKRFPNPIIQIADEDLHPLLQEDTHDGSLDTEAKIHAEVYLDPDEDHVCISGGIGNTMSVGDLEYNIVMLEPAQALSLLAWLSLNRKTLEDLVHKENEEQ